MNNEKLNEVSIGKLDNFCRMYNRAIRVFKCGKTIHPNTFCYIKDDYRVK